MKRLKNAELNVGGKSIQVKMACTEVNNRNYSLRKTEELLKGHSSVSGQEIIINWETDEQSRPKDCLRKCKRPKDCLRKDLSF